LGTAIRRLTRPAREARADDLLADRPQWAAPDGDLLVVAAHPNDEVRCAGGLIRAWAARGCKVSVLSVSDGQEADTRGQAPASARREELNEALRKLCPTHVAVTRLGLPVGKVGQHLNRLRNSLLSLASGAVTLIAPHERHGCSDREAVGGVCLEFARSRQITLARYAVGSERGEVPTGETRWVKFPLSDDARRAKARAVECFKSQIEPRRLLPARGAGPPDRAYEIFLL
jgi:LmbE family N-acetylglucosaminyl deacetylase